MQDVLLCSPVRTAIGAYNGSLKSVSAAELGAAAIKATLQRSDIPDQAVCGVIMGNVLQAGNKMNVARQAGVGAGLPVSVPAMTINRVCGSGAQAIATAAQEVALGLSPVMIAGGMENMDRAPYLLEGGRWGYRMGNGQVLDSMLHDGLYDAFSGEHSGWHTEDLVERYQISREAQDEWAARSQQRFEAARAAGRFADEIVGVEVKARKGVEIFEIDEAPRPDTTVDTLAKLRPAFRKDGTITAGNAPGLNSGASAMIVADRASVDKHGLEPAARLVAWGVGAVEPGMFGLGPIPAMHQAFSRSGWKLPDVERVEINEAFAVVPLVIAQESGLPTDIINVEGGAVAHGHPIGATGAILTTRLIHSMKRDGLRRGLVTLCIGGGQGVALLIEVN